MKTLKKTLKKTIYLHMVCDGETAPWFTISDDSMNSIPSYSIVEAKEVLFKLPDPQKAREQSIIELERLRDVVRAKSAKEIIALDNQIANLCGVKFDEDH